jgi:uncharacterized protein
MEFKVSELEKEPIDFDRELAPGVVDFGEDAEQQGLLATSGHAEVLHEHRGPKDVVADIRLRGSFAGRFQVPCARCVEPVEIPLEAAFDLIFPWLRTPMPRNAPLLRRRRKSGII